MNHLEERLSALIDDELGPTERERALGHLAGCDSCRFEAEMLRELKRGMGQLDPPEPSVDFMGRLAAMAPPLTPEGPPSGGPPAGPPPSSGESAGGPRHRRPAERFGSRRRIGESTPLGGSRPLGGATVAPVPRPWLRPNFGRARYAVAGASVLAMALGTAFVASGQRAEQPPAVAPPLADSTVERPVTARQVSLSEAPVGLTPSPLQAETGWFGGQGAVPAAMADSQ
ncbi:zf-HC2 domain-containing protein [Salinactinospora qingdaonensis]|uniref:Putative zinc-finger domain-containing protein n=1 Tax=Salinactinospora qingdaonensis TaxID=702744 RepID=A0ABP7FKA0_9ACTN